MDHSTHLFIYGLSDEETWALYARVKSICDKRGVRLHNAFETLPGYAQGMILGIAMVCGMFAIQVFIIAGFVGFRHGTHSGHAIWYAVITCGLFAALIALTQRKGRVKLYYRHSIEREREARRRALLIDVLKIILGAVLGVVGTLLVSHITHKN